MNDDLRLADALREIANVASYPAIGHFFHRRAFRGADLEVRLDGQVHVVTGGTAGIGLAIARGLARRGATVVIVGRDPRRAEAARRAIDAADVEIERADLASVAATHALADRLLARHPQIHALINNAGVALWDRRASADGVEATFATNVLGGFILAHRLLPALARASPARLVHITSAALYTQRLDVDGLLDRRGRPYRGAIQYARTKRAQVELSALFAERFAGLGVTSNCAHPGLAATPGTAASIPLYHRVFEPVLRDPDQGADTAVWLAASPAARDRTGELFFDRAPRPTHLLPWTRAPRSEAERLWDACAEIGRVTPSSLEVKR